MSNYTITQLLITGPTKTGYRNGVGKPEGVVLHATDNWEDSAIAERNYSQTNWQNAYVHFFVDDKLIVQAWDTDYIAYGAGKYANQRYMHIELCQTRDKNRFLEAYNRYVWLAAYVLKKYNMEPKWGDTLVTHHWVTINLGGTTHTDPDDYLAYHGVTIDQLISDIQQAYANLDDLPVKYTMFYRNLYLTSPMMYGDDVRALQNRLAITADGYFGSKTKQAVVNWQKAHDMIDDGVVTEEIWDLIFSQDDVFDSNSSYHRNLMYTTPLMRGADIQQLQQRLGIEQNGFFGVKTQQAVQNWQRTHDMIDDGVVDETTWNLILSQDNTFDQVNDYHRDLSLSTPLLYGADVQRLQQQLGIEQNGFYGEKTIDAVKNWQKDHDMIDDGIVTETLWDAIFGQEPIFDYRDGYHRILSYNAPLLRGNDVQQIQQKLGIEQNGYFGTKTKQAVMNWQNAHDMLNDGVVDEELWVMLMNDDNPFDQNDKYHRDLTLSTPLLRGADVQRLQNKLGIDQNGYYGEKTVDTVINWQKSNGFKPDGKVTQEMWLALFPEDKPNQVENPPQSPSEGFQHIVDRSWVDNKRNWDNPDIMLAKPDRTVIAKLKNIVVNNYEINLGQLNKIEFETPAYINKYGEFKLNRYLDKLYEKYLLRVTLHGISEWMVISEIHEIDDQSERVSVTAFSLAHELSFRTIRGYNVTSYNLTMIMNDLLQDTLWTLGDVDPYFNTLYRSPQLDGSVLDCIFKVADTFNAIIDWDTENRKIHFKRPENIGQNRGLKFKLGKYLKAITRDRLGDEAFTRLVPYGRDGLQIHRVNPTGQPYIEDFTYYMLPFERDENRNVIQSSRYMSDELCHAILDYNEFVASKEGEFSGLLDQKESLEEQKMTKEAELDQLNEDLKKIEDRLAIQRQTGALTIIDTTYDGWSKTYQAQLKKENYYAVMIKVSDTNNLTIKLDDVVKSTIANTWVLIGKIRNQEITKINLSGSATNVSVKIYVVEISSEEYDQTGNESAIIEKYNEDNKQAQIDAKQAEIDTIDAQIDDVDDEIENLRNELALENHFTPELLKERQAYIFQTEFSDENYTNDRELYEDAKKKLAEIAFPKTNLTIDIVNLFDVLDPKVQREWDKLTLGDYVNIEHETLKINYEAQIIGISFDFENKEIKLTIGSLRNKNDNGSPADKLKNLYKNAISSSTTIQNNKYKWNKIDEHETAINKILNDPWDATKQAIIAGSNKSVLIDNKGLRITDPNNPKEFLIANNAVLALTDDGGQTWKHAITTKGIVGERIYGGILIGANLYLENESGLFRFDKDGAIFDSTAIKMVTSHKGINFDLENVIKETPVNTWTSNDNISTIPADPVVLPDNQAVNHTVNKDGTVNISFEWKYNDDGTDKYDIDGFIVYLYVSSSSAEYQFGTDVANEYNFVVSDSKKALILYNLPAGLYYTFGVQAYRMVNTSINKSGILKSAIVKSSIDIENPYNPASNEPFDGDIRGTLTTNDMTQVVSKIVQLGYVYNGVQIDTNSGLVVTRSDNNFRSVFNATDGIKLQAKVNENWENRFYVDFDGTLRARKLILENENGDIILDGKNGTLDFGKFNAIFGTIKAENIEAKSITADQIKDNSVKAENLHTLAKDLVNNFTKTSDINTGWSIIAGQGTVTAGTSVTKNNTPEVILETSSDATYASDYIPIDSSKTYKATISLYCDDNTGTRYFGVYAYDVNKSLIAVTEWNVSGHSWGSATTTPYFWYGDGVIADLDGNPVYRDMEAYILSSNISDDGVPTGRNVDKHFKLPPEARYIRIFVANNNNNGTYTQVNIWSPTVIATDALIFSFNQGQGGQIKLGGANGVSGSLIIANENNETFVDMNSNGVFISKLIVNDIECDSVLTIENEDTTFYVDPINGNDENDGLTTLTPFKSIQRAVNSTRRSNDGTTQIILLGNNYTFNEHVDMGGYTGKGKILLTFPTDKSVTMYGTLKIVNTNAFIQIDNAVISWTEHPNPDLVLVTPLYIERCRGVFINNCKLFAQNLTQYGAYLTWGSFAHFKSCEISGGLQSSIVLENSNAYVEDCIGTSFEGIRVKGASVLGGTGTAPKGSSGSDVVTTHGGVCNATFTYTNGTSTPPATPTTITKQWPSIASASFRNKVGAGWRNEDDYVYQGEFVYNGTHFGLYKGFWFFPSDMFDTIQGKTIKRIQLYCTRLAQGGNPESVNIGFYYHTYSDEATARNITNPSVNGVLHIIPFKWGDHKWIDLPSSWFTAFSNGTAKGVAIYTTNSNDYAIFSGSAQIRITYQ